MVTLEQTHNGQTRRATVTRGPVGWHYQEVLDSTVVREVTYMDWHRVERAMQVFERRDADVHSTKR